MKEQGYATTLIGQEAARVVAEHDPETPLFLYLAFTAPHSSYQAPQEYLDRYPDIADPNRRAYAAMISAMDHEIGRVLDALEKRGMRENTLVVFHSDNGGNRSAMFAGEFDVSKLELPSDNGPYRDGKGTLFEGGTRVAALANWPGRIQVGTVTRAMHVVDMHPTLAKLRRVGARRETARWPRRLADDQRRGAVTAHRDRLRRRAAPRRRPARQVEAHLADAAAAIVLLFDIEGDPSEQTDVATAHPAEVAELRKRAEELAMQSAKSLFMPSQLDAMKKRPAAPPLPTGEEVVGEAS